MNSTTIIQPNDGSVVVNIVSLQTWKKFVSFRDPSLEFIIISAKYPTKNQQFRHFTQIDDWFLLQNCQNTLYFIILSTKEVLFLLKTSILLQLWKKFPQLYRNFRDPGSRGSRVFPCLQTISRKRNSRNTLWKTLNWFTRNQYHHVFFVKIITSYGWAGPGSAQAMYK